MSILFWIWERVMEIKQMIYFKTIVEEGTISKAAQVLHMAQPPLSMATQTTRRGIRRAINEAVGIEKWN